MTYNKLNNLVGWLVFAITLVLYTLTVAPTSSFWDCGEFIATAYGLEVPHPPGAPLFLMLGRFFSLFAASPEQVAFMVNMISVLSGAFMALFICWTVTILAKRVLMPNGQPDSFQQATILFAGAVGGLTCAFLDTVWFNSVEAEVYSLSSLFTSMVFWLMLKWEARADEPGHLRWIIFIAFMMGLSVGVHLLNLLTIPALALIYYFRKHHNNESRWGIAVSLFIGMVVLAIVQFGVIQFTWDIAWGFEKFFTGTITPEGKKPTGLGMPFGTGTLLFALLVFGGLIFGIYYSQKKQKVTLNVALICLLMIYLGFSSYLTITIRSNAEPPIDQNNPGNIVNFLSYLKREQYGDKPLLYGQMYNTPINSEDPYKRKGENYIKLKEYDRYVFDGYKLAYNYERRGMRFFPRMSEPDHYTSGPFGYKNFVTNKGANADDPQDDKPSGMDNMRFFFGYQVNHMYLRYFMWNFVGRSSDIQHDDWESGLNFKKLGDMPEEMRKAPTRNHYYFLPLILGIIGLSWHFMADKRRASIVGILFLFTGLAIVVYLNQVAQEPRERDYAFVGSYHTFAIWVGLGVVPIALALFKYLKSMAAYAAGTLCLVAVPGLLLAQNYDDHNRSGQYMPPDSAYNLLNSCAPNAILFTNGDNDTFPLWYIQEVEGVRTDVRVVNLSLLNTDWYIYQLKYNKAGKSDPLPITLDDIFFMGDKNQSAAFRKQTFKLKVDKEQIVKLGIVKPDEAAQILSPMLWTVTPRGSGENTYLMKQDMVILDMVVTNADRGWTRPIYFANTVGTSNYIGLGDFMGLQGMAYRIIPVKDADNQNINYGLGRVNLELMYDNLVHKFRYRGLNDPSIFFDDNTQRMTGNYRNSFLRLASAYLERAEKLEASLQNKLTAEKLNEPEAQVREKIDLYRKRAREVVAFGEQTVTVAAVPPSGANQYLTAMVYDRMNEKAKAEALLKQAHDKAYRQLLYYEKYPSPANDDENDHYFVLERSMQFFAANQKFNEAAQYAQEMFQLTNDTRYQSMAQQYQSMRVRQGVDSSQKK